ncbi:FAD-dependent oxidoreductase [Adlercreutzia mucosicola]|uniref:FAD-dependent oxidoreductase n=1 Tax=Adlercreutzia mucosicola TaxID=580026 RepID=UPI002B23F06A|nr:FAD-binding protein [Adlercreutzia mucosicola]MEB1813256.1 FAD-binding protein [Adlercreutzia mucosicola]
MADMNRRSFLGLGAAMVSGMALSGLAGCAPSADKDAEDSSEETLPMAGAESAIYAERVSGVDRFAIAPAKTSDMGEPDETCDWLVIGGGNTGLFAAIHGLELGMDTILLEKNPLTGGAGGGTEATMILNDAKYLQEANSPCGSSEEVYHYFQMQNAWLSDAKLISNYIKHLHGPHDWLHDHGMKTVFCATGGVEAPCGGIMYEGMGSGVNAFVTEAFEREGGRLMTNTAAKRLVVDDDGAVVGVVADTKEKEGAYISARNVFLGTGGFGSNPDMVAYYIGEAGTIAYKRDEQMGIPHDGDGICMAFGVGAVEAREMWTAAPGQGSPADLADIWDGEVDRACREANLWVNDLGKRIGNEKWNAISSNFGTAYRQKGGYYWNVFDQTAVKRMETEPFVMGSRWVIAPEGDGDPIPTMGAALEEAVGGGSVWKGETIEELASSAGIDAEGLKATVERYNELARNGVDEDFWKDPVTLHELAEGPFYAIKVVPTWFCTLCGVKVDEDLHVVDENGYPIKGLYAGGADASQFFTTEYSHGFGGSCSGFAYFSGWYAAEVAASSL